MFKFVTSSGRTIGPSTTDLRPSDLFPNLQRHMRFGGSTLEPWNVCQHSLLAYNIAQRLTDDPAKILACLLHDAHEAFTGDVPTQFKGDWLRKCQDALDHVILSSFGLPTALIRDNKQFVKKVDKKCLHTEAYMLMPPTFCKAEGIGQPIADHQRMLSNIISWDDRTQEDEFMHQLDFYSRRFTPALV